MAVEIQGRRGNTITLLSPREKGQKAASELRDNIKKTNRFQPKVDKNGETIKLSSTEAAYRMGYLKARIDIGKACKSRNR